MRCTVLTLFVAGLLAVPILAQNTVGQETTPKTEPSFKPGEEKKTGDKKDDPKKENTGDKKPGDKTDPKPGDKGKDEPKTGGKELKIIGQGPWMMPLPPDPNGGGKDKTLILNSFKDLMKMPPFNTGTDKLSSELLEKYMTTMLNNSLKVEKIDFEKQMLVIITSTPGTLPGYTIKVSKVEVKDGKANIFYGLAPPAIGTPPTPLPAAAVLIEKFEGKVEFTKEATKNPTFPGIGPDGKPLVSPTPIGPDGKPLPPAIGPDGKPFPPAVGPDGKPLTVPPLVGPDGKPLPLPKPGIGPDGKPLPIPGVGVDIKPLPTPPSLGPDGKPLAPAIGPDGKPLPLPKPGVGPDGKPLAPAVDKDGKPLPLPAPTITPLPQPGTTPPALQPNPGTPLPGLPGLKLPVPAPTPGKTDPPQTPTLPTGN